MSRRFRAWGGLMAALALPGHGGTIAVQEAAVMIELSPSPGRPKIISVRREQIAESPSLLVACDRSPPQPIAVAAQPRSSTPPSAEDRGFSFVAIGPRLIFQVVPGNDIRMRPEPFCHRGVYTHAVPMLLRTNSRSTHCSSQIPPMLNYIHKEKHNAYSSARGHRGYMSWLGNFDGFGSADLWRLNGRRCREFRFEAGCLRTPSVLRVPWILRLQWELRIRWVPAVLPNLSQQSSIGP
jgi:hypothetical protein